MAVVDQTKDERGVVWLTLNRPRTRNALNAEVMSDLRSAILALVDPSDVRALVIRGSSGTFSSGRDLKEAEAMPYEQAAQQHAIWADVFRALHRLPIPSVAVVEGHAVAGGFTLAMGCDFVLAERSAAFGALEMSNGFPAAVCTPILTRLANPRVGLELALFGDTVSAERLYDVGLVNQLADGSDALAKTVRAFTDRIAMLEPLAVQQTLETYRAAEQVSIDKGLTMGMHLNQLLDATGSFAKGGERLRSAKNQTDT